MPIVAPLEPPAFAGEVQPRAALLWYEAEGRGLGTLHPLSATRRDRKSTRLNSSHRRLSRMPSSA